MLFRSTLHVFAKTHATPPQWWYRTLDTPAATSRMPNPVGSWSPWQQLNLDIASDQVVPVMWDNHLYLLWPIFKQISEQQSAQAIPTPSSSQSGSQSTGSDYAPQSPAQRFWSVEFALSELSASQWQPKRTINEKMYFCTEDPALAFTFQASQDAQYNLNIEVYFTGFLGCYTVDRKSVV